MPETCTLADDLIRMDGWVQVAHLVPADIGVVPQYAVPVADGWAMTQGRDSGTGSNATDDLILSRFEGEKLVETRTFLKGGHGDRAYSVDGRLVVQIHGVWRTVVPGIAPTAAATPARCALPGLVGLQGEVGLPDGRWLRLYGESIKGGTERDPTHRPAFLQVIEGVKVVLTIDLDNVARDEAGLPIGGRYEPEGATVGDIDGEPWILVGFAVGRLGNTTMNVYGKPLRLVNPTKG